MKIAPQQNEAVHPRLLVRAKLSKCRSAVSIKKIFSVISVSPWCIPQQNEPVDLRFQPEKRGSLATQSLQAILQIEAVVLGIHQGGNIEYIWIVT